jgi:limonene-1,2-epoxide hydrolase
MVRAMAIRVRTIGLVAGLLLAAAGSARAEAPAIVYAESLQAEWSVETTRTGQAHVIGYLYNRNIMDAANVRLRVDRIGADGSVVGTYRRGVVGDVLSDGRSIFDVPVPDSTAAYRVTVETVDWVKECR